jgi:hypothetical protein
MKLRRVISVYEKEGEKFLSEYSLNDVPIERLKEIIAVKDDDPELFDVHPIGEKERYMLAFLVPQLKELDFNQVELFYECFSE